MEGIKYELYEDEEGGLSLYLLDDDWMPKAVYGGWELAPEPGIMLDVVAGLENGIGPDIIYKVCCDADMAYFEDCENGELIANNGWVQRGALMNAAGRRAFGYPEW